MRIVSYSVFIGGDSIFFLWYIWSLYWINLVWNVLGEPSLLMLQRLEAHA